MKPGGQRFFSSAPFIPLLIFGVLSGLAGCASLPDAEDGSVPVVAVLINRTWVEQDPRGFVWEVSQDEKAVEAQFAGCVSRAASSMKIPVRVITGTQFRALAFPDLDPRAAPRSMETLRSLIPDPRFRKRVEAAGIDYIAVLGGETLTSETKGAIGCFAGYGGGGCIGSLWWDHESHLSALVVDMRSGSERLREGVDSAGTSWFAMLAIFPLAAPSLHETKGCERFGGAVASALAEMHHQGE